MRGIPYIMVILDLANEAHLRPCDQKTYVCLTDYIDRIQSTRTVLYHYNCGSFYMWYTKLLSVYCARIPYI